MNLIGRQGDDYAKREIGETKEGRSAEEGGKRRGIAYICQP